MANGILLGSNSLLPAIGQSPNGNIVTCTEIFTCHEYRHGLDPVMYLGVKETGVYAVSYSITPDTLGDIDRRYLVYSDNEYLIAIGSDVELGTNYYSESSEHHTNYYYGTIGSTLGRVSNLVYNSAIYNYDNLEAALAGEGIVPYGVYPITYRLTNCTAPAAPAEAAIGDTVTVPIQFTSGYGIVNPSSDVYVTNNGVVVPSQYSNDVLTFTMPDPS